MSAYSAGNQNPYESLARFGEGMGQVLSLGDVTGFGRLASDIGSVHKSLSQVIERINEDVRPLNEYLVHSDFNRAVTKAIGALNQQWAKPLTALGLQASLISKSVTMDMNVATEALGKAAVMLNTRPKPDITLPRVDVVNSYPAVITRRNRPFWSDRPFEEDDPPIYGEGLEGDLLTALDELFLPVSANEFRESFGDLHRKPRPDPTGAISHANAGFLSVARAIHGKSKANPREIVARYRHLFPKPLDDAVLQLWGFSSQYGRKVSEDKIVEYHQAEAVVYGIALITLLLIRAARKSGPISLP